MVGIATAPHSAGAVLRVVGSCAESQELRIQNRDKTAIKDFHKGALALFTEKPRES